MLCERVHEPLDGGAWRVAEVGHHQLSNLLGSAKVELTTTTHHLCNDVMLRSSPRAHLSAIAVTHLAVASRQLGVGCHNVAKRLHSWRGFTERSLGWLNYPTRTNRWTLHSCSLKNQVPHRRAVNHNLVCQ